MKIIDLTGIKFHNLLVVAKTSKRTKSGGVIYICNCESCGKENFEVCGDHLTRKTNPIKSCGCQKPLQGQQSPFWKGCGEISGNFWNRKVLRNLKNRGERRRVLGVSVSIEYAWDLFIKQDRKCALSGIELIISDNYHENTASIDRIDSDIGYHPGNIQWVHKDINRVKNVYDQEYFIELCRKVANYNDKKQE